MDAEISAMATKGRERELLKAGIRIALSLAIANSSEQALHAIANNYGAAAVLERPAASARQPSAMVKAAATTASFTSPTWSRVRNRTRSR
ncbi:MAG TPA: hypothetical protein VGI19_14465 [Candidatus Cybelea sp.]